jgi:hypothetical protein
MKLTTVLGILAALAFATTAKADLSYTFNTDVEGFQNVSWQSGPAGWSGLPSVKQGHTAGGWQMQLTKEFAWGPGGGDPNQQTAMQALANFGDNAHLSFDVMADGTSFPAATAGWYQFNVVGNSDGSAGWTQKEKLVDGWHNADQADLLTWHFDVPFSFLGWQPGDTWFQFWTGCNSEGAFPVNFFLDNVTAYAVPEPSILGLAGLGAAALLAFRRR